MDSAGQAYICGRTSDGFPTVNTIYPTYGLGDGGNINGYLARISADGSKLVYSTYLATIDANANMIACGVAVDVAGTAYVTGNVSFENFVTTANTFQPDFGGASPDAPAYGDAFVMVIASESEPPAPSPTISCPGNMIVSAPAGQCSAVVSYSVSAASQNTRCVEVTCVPLSGSAFPVGTTTVNCIAKDAVGATAMCSFTVTVNDTKRPTINCPANIVVNVPCGQSSMAVNYPTPSATDNCSGVTVSCTPASGSIFPVGTSTVNCTARDASGNTASCSFSVTANASPVAFTGFLAPIGGADANGGSFANPLRAFKLKSTIPVKFKASCDISPVPTGVHTLQAIKYSDETTAGAAIDATSADAATTGNQFRLTDSEWHFNLDTKAIGMNAGIWLLRATLSDGSQHSAWVQIK